MKVKRDFVAAVVLAVLGERVFGLRGIRFRYCRGVIGFCFLRRDPGQFLFDLREQIGEIACREG